MANILWNLFTTPVYTPSKILVNGTVEFFYPGTTGESNRKDVFLDAAGAITAANPYTLDSNATASLYADEAEQYHIIIKDEFGSTEYDFDYITPEFLNFTSTNQANAVETKTLTSGQTAVTFSVDATGGILYINGNDADSGRLLLSDDYSVAGTDVTLVQSYPAGTKLTLAYYDPTASTSNLKLVMTDGVPAPGATAGFAQIYVDTSDGDLKVVFGDGTVKTIVVDT